MGNRVLGGYAVSERRLATVRPREGGLLAPDHVQRRRAGTMNFDFSELERGENMSYKWFSDVGTRVENMHAK